MVDTVDTDRCDGEAFQRGEKDTAQSVADGDAVARFQRAEFESATEVVGFEHDYLVGFLKR